MMLFDISVVSVVLSLCGVLLTWVTFYTFEESRCSSRRLLLACSLSDFGQSGNNISSNMMMIPNKDIRYL